MKKILYIAAAIIVMGACKERFDLDPEQSVWIVAVDAVVTNEYMVHKAIITSSKRVTNTHIPYISGATVQLVENNTDTITYIESDSVKGIYLSPFAFSGKPGSTYEIIVSGIDFNSDGVNDISKAKETMPGLITLDSIGLERIIYPQIQISGWFVNCYAWDSPSENYYLFRAWKNSTLVSDTLYEVFFTDDMLFNGRYTNGIQTVFFDEYKKEYINPGDTITLGVYNTTKSVFNFYSQAYESVIRSNPMFGGPPANIESNFSNGVKGFFEVYTIAKSTTIAPDDVWEYRGK